MTRANSLKTVLIVDVNNSEALELAGGIGQYGFKTILAHDIHEAFSLFCSKPIDVVVADAHMADGSGIELLARVKAFAPDKPVILLVGNDSKFTLLDLYDLGAGAALGRPTSVDHIVASIHQTLEASLNRRPTRPPRLHVNLNIDLEYLESGVEISAKTANIANGGVFVDLPAHLLPKAGTLLSFHLHLERPRRNEIKGEAIVRWARKKTPDLPAGIGLEFIVMSEDHRACIFEFTDSLRNSMLSNEAQS